MWANSKRLLCLNFILRLSHISNFPLKTSFSVVGFKPRGLGILDKSHEQKWCHPTHLPVWTGTVSIHGAYSDLIKGLNRDRRSRRGQHLQPDFTEVIALWWCQLQPTTWPLVCASGDRQEEKFWLSVSAHLCWGDLLKLLSVCLPACLSGCTDHVSVHFFIWIWSRLCSLSLHSALQLKSDPVAPHTDLLPVCYLISGFPAEAPCLLDPL